MSFPFTPAEIAAFRSALKAIAEAIESGERAKSDDRYVALLRGFEVREPFDEQAVPTHQDENSAPKEILSFFPWFGKKKKSDSPIKPPVTPPPVVKAEPVGVAKPADRIPSIFHLQSTDTRVAGRFIADIPWSGRTTASEVTGHKFQDMEVGLSREIADREPLQADNRIAGRFFSELPWSTSTAHSDVIPESAPQLDAETIDAGAAVLAPAVQLKTQSAQAYFGDLPWGNHDVKTEIIAFATEAAVELKDAVLSDLLKPPVEGGEEAVQQKTQAAREYFLKLPWILNKTDVFAETHSEAGEALDYGVSPAVQIPVSVEVTRVDKGSDGAVTDISAQRYFSRLAWLPADATLGTASLAELTVEQNPRLSHVEITEVLRCDQPFGSFFQTLPWQGEIKAERALESNRPTVSYDNGAAEMFSLATESAIRASQKAQPINVPKERPRTDSFFRALPWRGPR